MGLVASATRKKKDPRHRSMGRRRKKKDPVADPAGGPQGAPPVEEAANAVPNSWKDNLHNTWESTVAHIDLGERETAFLSEPELLLDQANELFKYARQQAKEKMIVSWPLPPNNADGSELTEHVEPFDKVVWKQEEFQIFGGSDEQHDPEYDGFLMREQKEALSYETDR